VEFGNANTAAAIYDTEDGVLSQQIFS
jgi:hypothetical protein